MHKARAVKEHIKRGLTASQCGNGSFVQHVELFGAHTGHARIAFEQRCVHVGGEHVCALCRHGQHAGLANALARCGDQYSLALQSQILAHAVSCGWVLRLGAKVV